MIEASTTNKRADDTAQTSVTARKRAETLLSALPKVVDFVPMPTIVPFGGGLQIGWKSTQGRSVQLFCSPNANGSYIYSRDKHAHKSKILKDKDVTVLKLANRLTWLFDHS